MNPPFDAVPWLWPESSRKQRGRIRSMSTELDHSNYRLGFLTSHPIQYQAPLFRKLAAHPDIDLTVFFCSDNGAARTVDPGFGVALKWDLPLLEGYDHAFLRNRSPRPSSTGFWQSLNPAIAGRLKAEHLDALIVHGYAQATNWLAFGGAHLSRTPLMLHGETMAFDRRPTLAHRARNLALRGLFGRTRAFFPIGSRSLDFYRGHGINDDRLFMTPYSVDNDYFTNEAVRLRESKDELRREAGLPTELPLVLYTGKLMERKRPGDLLLAFRRVQGRAALLFVGDGDLKEALELFTRRHQISHVYFAGFRNQTELPRYYAMADVFALPSAYETWGLVINEAMCFGLPIVTTDAVAASYDLVRDGENGYVTRVGDVEALGNALSCFVDVPEVRERMGRRSAEIIAPWNHDACVSSIVQALDTTIGKPTRLREPVGERKAA